MTEPSAAQVASETINYLANGADKAFSFATDLAAAMGSTGAKTLDLAGHAAGVVGTNAAHLTLEAWDVLVRQQVASGAVGLFRWALGWGTFYMLLRATRSARTADGGFTREKGPTRSTWLGAACALVFVAQLGIGYLEVPLSLMRIINPRYYAAAELVQVARAMK